MFHIINYFTKHFTKHKHKHLAAAVKIQSCNISLPAGGTKQQLSCSLPVDGDTDTFLSAVPFLSFK